MQIGVSLSSTHPRQGPALMIERAAAAYAAGLASLSIGDHHNMAVPYAQNTPMLGRLLAEWPDRPAGCLFLVPLWHPLLMAEHIGTLAAMHAGRFIVQTGIGYGPKQFAALGRDHATRGARLEAAIPLVQRLLAGETVDAPEFDMWGATVGLLPEVSSSGIEWWIAGGVEVAVRRAARLGDAWYASAGATVAASAPAMRVYREAGGQRAIVRLDALVLGDGDTARRHAAELVGRGYRGMTLEQLVVGSPDDAAERVAEFAEAGFDGIIFRCMSVPQDLALETLANLGSLV